MWEEVLSAQPKMYLSLNHIHEGYLKELLVSYILTVRGIDEL